MLTQNLIYFVGVCVRVREGDREGVCAYLLASCECGCGCGVSLNFMKMSKRFSELKYTHTDTYTSIHLHYIHHIMPDTPFRLLHF